MSDLFFSCSSARAPQDHHHRRRRRRHARGMEVRMQVETLQEEHAILKV